MIECKDVLFKYDSSEEAEVEKIAVNGVSLTVNKGEFVAILGCNGSGKSTLAKHMNALLLPSEGKVYVDGMDTCKEDNIWSIRKSTGMVFQNPRQSVGGNNCRRGCCFWPRKSWS